MKSILSFVAAVAVTAPLSAQQIDPDLYSPKSPGFTGASQPLVGPAMTGLTFRTIGTDNYTAGDFYQVKNNSSVPVSTITLDISVIAGAFFDYDGGAGYGAGLGPEITFTAGMLAGDVAWGFTGTHPTVVTATITPPMAPGAEFHFGTDTDFFVSDPCPGGNFGSAPATVTVADAAGNICSEPMAVVSGIESMVDCQLGGLVLTGPFPGTPGVANTLRYLGAGSGNLVVLAWGRGPGVTPVPPCPGLDLDIHKAKVLDIQNASASGDGSYTQFVPGNAAGLTVYLQAADLIACGKSNLITHTF